MNLKLTSPSLPGGWDCYCPGCEMFFSVSKDKLLEIKYCPKCGRDTVIKSPKEFEEAYPHYKARAS